MLIKACLKRLFQLVNICGFIHKDWTNTFIVEKTKVKRVYWQYGSFCPVHTHTIALFGNMITVDHTLTLYYFAQQQLCHSVFWGLGEKGIMYIYLFLILLLFLWKWHFRRNLILIFGQDSVFSITVASTRTRSFLYSNGERETNWEPLLQKY